MTDPTTPTKIGHYDTGGSGVYAVTLSSDGTKAFIANHGLVVLDVTNPTNHQH
ncbi:hypothetical protein [Candidatus Marithrix sp. Canyon 246]|uniref:hypothetical protein n=1 Tax=Candidatus Marithrix sp. Canyon 246 TaxID=1827136 RepID=UPI00403D6C2B